MTDSGSHYIVVGDVMVDTFAAIDTSVRLGADQGAMFTRAIGGQAANTASWLAHLGAQVRLVASCGDDDESSWVAAQLHSRGVGTHLHHAAEPTGRCVIIVDDGGRRTMFSDPGANRALALVPKEAWTPLLFDDVTAPRRHLHLSGYLIDRSPTLVPTIAALAHGTDTSVASPSATVSIDTAAIAVTAQQRETLVGALPYVDLMIGTVEELAAFLPRDIPEPKTVDHVMDAWRNSYGAGTTLVVKNGADGASADADGTRVHQAAHRVSAVDTTGAGDAFTAGFLAAWSPGREHLAQALAAGADVAALAVRHLGAGPPSAEGR